MKIRPVGSYVAVKPQELPQGSLVVAEDAKEEPTYGEVIAVSDQCEIALNVGDTVLYKQWSPDVFRLPGNEEMFLLLEEDIMAVIE